MTKPTTLQFATMATAHARINQLESLLGLPLSAEQPVIGKAWDEIDRLEALLAAKPTQPATPTTPAAPTKPTPAANDEVTDPPTNAPQHELRGIARAAAAQREGRTAKPTPTVSAKLLVGIMRAAKGQEEINRRSKS
ncbi:MAG: hypothetical protein QOI07_156 [Verrucomicrobiota bacterium]|jgi:hypothetical protein